MHTRWIRPARLLAIVAAVFLGSVVLVSTASTSDAAERSALPKPHKDLPEDFQQIIPRGHIASIDAPEFVSAAEAKIADDAWVLGVEIDGQARAYSLNLLNRHEVVNDTIGERSFAAVW